MESEGDRSVQRKQELILLAVKWPKCHPNAIRSVMAGVGAPALPGYSTQGSSSLNRRPLKPDKEVQIGGSYPRNNLYAGLLLSSQ